MTDYYNKNAKELFGQYQARDSDQVHRCWLHLLPEQPGLACDIGAGSGRDARWLAQKGWDVTAVEPSAPLRALGEAHTTAEQCHSGSVTWLDDALPDLKRLRSLDQRFQLILISAVWMHLLPTQHERAMRIVSELLAPGGVLVITLRHGEDNAGRFHPISADQLVSIARDRALVNIIRERNLDTFREGIEWDCLVFVLPGKEGSPKLSDLV
jgi:SAM-dependent methyltransferase